jgi:hypothetical protein
MLQRFVRCWSVEPDAVRRRSTGINPPRNRSRAIRALLVRITQVFHVRQFITRRQNANLTHIILVAIQILTLKRCHSRLNMHKKINMNGSGQLFPQ